MAEANTTQNSPLVWTCHECRFPIEDFRGGVIASYATINDGAAVWRSWHYTCQPREGYTIDASTLRSADDAVRWTAHLMGKGWFSDCDWDLILGSIASAPGVPA